jgi:hypothetical protein
MEPLEDADIVDGLCLKCRGILDNWHSVLDTHYSRYPYTGFFRLPHHNSFDELTQAVQLGCAVCNLLMSILIKDGKCSDSNDYQIKLHVSIAVRFAGRSTRDSLDWSVSLLSPKTTRILSDDVVGFVGDCEARRGSGIVVIE